MLGKVRIVQWVEIIFEVSFIYMKIEQKAAFEIQQVFAQDSFV